MYNIIIKQNANMSKQRTKYIYTYMCVCVCVISITHANPKQKLKYENTNICNDTYYCKKYKAKIYKSCGFVLNDLI